MLRVICSADPQSEDGVVARELALLAQAPTQQPDPGD